MPNAAFRLGRPAGDEASPFHFGYIDQVTGDDVLAVLGEQSTRAASVFARYTEAASLHRYAPDKWSVRQVVNHITDTERIFTFRALWFARGLEGALPSFEQDIAVAGAEADTVPFADLVEEFRRVRLATLSLFDTMPESGWGRAGTASGHRVTVRAVAFMSAGHVEHHLKILRDRYASL